MSNYGQRQLPPAMLMPPYKATQTTPEGISLSNYVKLMTIVSVGRDVHVYKESATLCILIIIPYSGKFFFRYFRYREPQNEKLKI